MADVLLLILGAAAVILALAGLSLLAVWVQGRLSSGSKSPPPGCPGEPSLERCRTCKYLQGLGDDSICTMLGRDPGDLLEESYGDGRREIRKDH